MNTKITILAISLLAMGLAQQVQGKKRDYQKVEQRSPEEATLDLVTAVKEGNIVKAQLALEDGALVNAQNEENWAAIHFACMSNDIPMVTLLLENGADTTLCNHLKQTALHIASEYNFVQLAQLLLSYDISQVNARDDNNSTPLQSACTSDENGSHLEIIKLLVTHGAVIEPNDIEKVNTPEVAQFLQTPKEYPILGCFHTNRPAFEKFICALVHKEETGKIPVGSIRTLREMAQKYECKQTLECIETLSKSQRVLGLVKAGTFSDTQFFYSK